jgi:hypothetical protein
MGERSHVHQLKNNQRLIIKYLALEVLESDVHVVNSKVSETRNTVL